MKNLSNVLLMSITFFTCCSIVAMEPALKRQKLDNPVLGTLLKKALETRSIDCLDRAIQEADGDVNRLISVDAFTDSFIGHTMLGYSAKDRNLLFVDYLIKHCARLDKEGEHNRTPLLSLVAVDWNHVSLMIMERLLDANASPNAYDSYGYYPLHYLALKQTASSGIRLLHSRHADINAQSSYSGKTALHLALENDSQDAVHSLIELGASVFVKDAKGESPIELAKRMDKPGVIRDYVRIVDWVEYGDE